MTGANLQAWFPHYKPPPEQNLHLERYHRRPLRLVDILNGYKIMQLRGKKFAKQTD